jgi:diguanylate cyclase (GGDEF)-like protein/putative nucleotidyltransferase with HDIG domain
VLEEALKELGPLPVLSGTVASVRTLASDLESSTEEIVATIEQDEAFAANVLRVANSAWATRRLPTKTIRQAVTLLGRTELVRLAVAARTYQFLEQAPGNGGISRGQMHLHAVTVAAYAAAAAEMCGADADTAHLAGLLHDVGKLVLPLAFGEEVLEAIALEEPRGVQRAALERERLGIDHAYVGALIADRSAAPGSVFDAIAFHHGGRSGQESPSPEAACVQIGNCLAGILGGAEPDHELLHVALTRAGLTTSALDELAQNLAGPGTTNAPLAQRVRRLERLAHTDALTEVSNRRHWLEHVETRLAAGTPGAVLICDVDRFKEVNDAFGHAAGDEVLIELAGILSRRGATGRLGGDEFAVWVDGDVETGKAAAQAVLADVAAAAAEGVYDWGVSIGVAVVPTHGTSAADLLGAADRALYDSKAAGRGRVTVSL